jgi:hypothetical protein
MFSLAKAICCEGIYDTNHITQPQKEAIQVCIEKALLSADLVATVSGISALMVWRWTVES